MRPPSTLADLLGAAVHVGTVQVGEVVGVFVDRGESRAIGLEVAGAGGARRFLPWFAARAVDEGVSVESALLLVEDGSTYERLGALPLRDRSTLGRLGVTPEGGITSLGSVSLNADPGT